MKVHSLIEALSKFPQEAEVQAFDVEYGDLVPVFDVTMVGDHVEIQTESPDDDEEEADAPAV